MSEPRTASDHLGIPVEEYDVRIRTFVPFYEEMLEEVQGLVASIAPERPAIVDLGIGTGALADRCLRARPSARVIGIDADPEMLALARSRLDARGRVELRGGSYLEAELPGCDVVVASLSLHHVPDPAAKRRLYAACRAALRPGGAMMLADCYLPATPLLVERGMASWRAHLERSYTADGARAYLEAWSGEDTYFPLLDEMDWLRGAGFRPDVIWRRELFAVLLCS